MKSTNPSSRIPPPEEFAQSLYEMRAQIQEQLEDLQSELADVEMMIFKHTGSLEIKTRWYNNV